MFFSYFIAFSFFLNCAPLYCSQYKLYRARTVRTAPAVSSYENNSKNESDGDKENSGKDKLSGTKLSAQSEKLIKELELCVGKFVVKAMGSQHKSMLEPLRNEAEKELRKFKSLINGTNTSISLVEKSILMKRYQKAFNNFDVYNKKMEKNKPKENNAKIEKRLPETHSKPSRKRDEPSASATQKYQNDRVLVQPMQQATPIYAAQISEPSKLADEKDMHEKKQSTEKRSEQPVIQVQVPSEATLINDQLQQLIDRVQERAGAPIIQGPVIHMPSEPLPHVSPIRALQVPEVTKQTNWPKKMIQFACVTGFVTWIVHKVCLSDQEEQQIEEQ